MRIGFTLVAVLLLSVTASAQTTSEPREITGVKLEPLILRDPTGKLISPDRFVSAIRGVDLVEHRGQLYVMRAKGVLSPVAIPGNPRFPDVVRALVFDGQFVWVSVDSSGSQGPYTAVFDLQTGRGATFGVAEGFPKAFDIKLCPVSKGRVVAAARDDNLGGAWCAVLTWGPQGKSVNGFLAVKKEAKVNDSPDAWKRLDQDFHPRNIYTLVPPTPPPGAPDDGRRVFIERVTHPLVLNPASMELAPFPAPLYARPGQGLVRDDRLYLWDSSSHACAVTTYRLGDAQPKQWTVKDADAANLVLAEGKLHVVGIKWVICDQTGKVERVLEMKGLEKRDPILAAGRALPPGHRERPLTVDPWPGLCHQTRPSYSHHYGPVLYEEWSRICWQVTFEYAKPAPK